jgi:ribosomal protein S18 acetylase RimI-like enzyme
MPAAGESTEGELPGAAELDHAVWGALTGPQRNLGTGTPLAARFRADVSPFGGFAGEPTADHWADLAGLVEPGGRVALTGSVGVPPADWTVERELVGLQMVGDRIGSTPDGLARSDKPIRLGDADVEDMLALVRLAQPGPFLPRTVEFGGYLGVRRQGKLVAMAGQRLRPPGFTEVSAVATDPDHRRQGLAEQLIRAVAGDVRERGDTPFLHVDIDNYRAIHLYESIGFTRRRNVPILVVRGPGSSPPD